MKNIITIYCDGGSRGHRLGDDIVYTHMKV